MQRYHLYFQHTAMKLTPLVIMTTISKFSISQEFFGFGYLHRYKISYLYIPTIIRSTLASKIETLFLWSSSTFLWLEWSNRVNLYYQNLRFEGCLMCFYNYSQTFQLFHTCVYGHSQNLWSNLLVHNFQKIVFL